MNKEEFNIKLELCETEEEVAILASKMLDILDQRNIALEQRVNELEQWYAELDYKFSCVLDNATGGKASKSNIDLEIAYKLISDNVNFWVDSAVKEIENSNA